MPVLRRIASILTTGVLAGASVLGTGGTAQADDIPPSPYCFTVDGTGVCVALTASVTHSPDLNASDVTAALTVQVGVECPGIALLACRKLGAPRTVEVGRSGVVGGNPTIADTHITDVRVPEVCLGVTCAGPYTVPVYAPMVQGSVATVWVLGQSSADPCFVVCSDSQG